MFLSDTEAFLQASNRPFTSSQVRFGKSVGPSWFFRYIIHLCSDTIQRLSITLSPVSIAALGLVPGTRGLSIRFPRFIRIREDKGLEQASTPKFLADMWQVQEKRGTEGKDMDEEELLDVDWESDVVEEDSS